MPTPKSPEESQATARLRVLSQGIRVYCLEPGYRYCVPSANGGLLAYEILVQEEEMTCNCPAGQNDRMCKHQAGVQMHMEAEAALELARSTTTANADLEEKIAELY